MYLFQAKIPKSSYFKRASLFGFYYYYMGIFSAVQILSTLGYLIGNIACRTGSAITSDIIEVSITFGSCESIILSYVLVFLRFKHPVLRMNLKKTCNFKKQPFLMADEEEGEEIWLGSLI